MASNQAEISKFSEKDAAAYPRWFSVLLRIIFSLEFIVLS